MYENSSEPIEKMKLSVFKTYLQVLILISFLIQIFDISIYQVKRNIYSILKFLLYFTITYNTIFIGKCFPTFLQNTRFIFRGKGLERLTDFNARVLDFFPKAELKTTLDDPLEDEKEDDKQQR